MDINPMGTTATLCDASLYVPELFTLVRRNGRLSADGARLPQGPRAAGDDPLPQASLRNGR